MDVASNGGETLGGWETEEPRAVDADVRSKASASRSADGIISLQSSLDDDTKMRLAIRTSRAVMPGVVAASNNSESRSGCNDLRDKSSAELEWSYRRILKNRRQFSLPENQRNPSSLVAAANEEQALDEFQERMAGFKDEANQLDELEREELAKQKRRKHCLCCIVGMLLMGCAAAGIMVGVRKAGDQASELGSNSTGARDEMLKQQEECITNESFVSDEFLNLQPIVLENAAPATADEIGTSGSYQRAALCWLSEMEAFFQASFKNGSLVLDDVFQARQRFALASIYYHWVPFTSSKTTAAAALSKFSRSNWLSGAHVCEWDFVTCDAPATRVTELSLETMALDRFIPMEIAQLSDIVILSLSDNSLTGTIPPELFHLTALEVLDLSRNALTGEIPLEMSGHNKLQDVGLNNNLLSGPIPIHLFEIPHLSYASIAQNGLTGSLPASLSNATGLTDLYISSNGLEGTIPDILKLTNLKVLGIYESPLIRDSFPDITTLTNLEFLRLSNADFSGNISNISWFFPKLETLHLGSTLLTGTIPSSFGLLTALEHLTLKFSKLSGSIPTELGNLSRLSFLDLSLLPDLTGTFPTELGLLSNLEDLFLPSESRISGTVPADICNLLQRPNSRLQQICGPSQCSCCTFCSSGS